MNWLWYSFPTRGQAEAFDKAIVGRWGPDATRGVYPAENGIHPVRVRLWIDATVEANEHGALKGNP